MIFVAKRDVLFPPHFWGFPKKLWARVLDSKFQKRLKNHFLMRRIKTWPDFDFGIQTVVAFPFIVAKKEVPFKSGEDLLWGERQPSHLLENKWKYSCFVGWVTFKSKEEAKIIQPQKLPKPHWFFSFPQLNGFQFVEAYFNRSIQSNCRSTYRRL